MNVEAISGVFLSQKLWAIPKQTFLEFFKFPRDTLKNKLNLIAKYNRQLWKIKQTLLKHELLFVGNFNKFVISYFSPTRLLLMSL